MVSIIIPVFNGERYLESTINSILNQKSSDWEVIIIDDGSTDNSTLICKEFSKKDFRIRFHERNSPPKGANTCRNIGVEKAKGEALIFLDADDLLSPGCIKIREKMLAESNKDFIVFPIANFFKAPGDSNFIWKPKERQDHLALFLKHDLPWQTTSTIWRKEYLDAIGGWDENYHRLQDVELHTRALIKGANYEIVSNKKPDFYYRVDPSRKSSEHSDRIRIQLESAFKYILDMRELLTANSKTPYIKYLKGTIFKAIRNALQSSLALQENPQIIHSIIESFVEELKIKTLINRNEELFLEYYKNGFNKGLRKLKGYNYLANKAFYFIK